MGNVGGPDKVKVASLVIQVVQLLVSIVLAAHQLGFLGN